MSYEDDYVDMGRRSPLPDSVATYEPLYKAKVKPEMTPRPSGLQVRPQAMPRQPVGAEPKALPRRKLSANFPPTNTSNKAPITLPRRPSLPTSNSPPPSPPPRPPMNPPPPPPVQLSLFMPPEPSAPMFPLPKADETPPPVPPPMSPSPPAAVKRHQEPARLCPKPLSDGPGGEGQMYVEMTPRPKSDPYSELQNGAVLKPMPGATGTTTGGPGHACHSGSGGIGCCCSEHLHQFNWFQDLEREDSHKGLMSYAKEGAYIVRRGRRAGRDSPFSLSLYHARKVFHLNIRKREDGQFALGRPKTSEKVFPSVEALVEFHQRENILLTSNGQPEGSALLVTPLPVGDLAEFFYSGCY